MPELQLRLVALIRATRIDNVTVTEEVAPPWLVRPGRAECGDLWSLVCDVYRTLTARDLPEVMPPRERRRLDAVLAYPDGAQRILEVDERQHFTGARATTLTVYPGRLTTAFDTATWARRCVAFAGREPGGGFARPCPPLFPGDGGRHRQRAFRDFLADALPSIHGWLPTLRITDEEARALLTDEDPDAATTQLLNSKTHP